MDGLIAAAGVQNVVPALEYPPEKIGEVSKLFFTSFYCALESSLVIGVTRKFAVIEAVGTC